MFRNLNRNRFQEEAKKNGAILHPANQTIEMEDGRIITYEEFRKNEHLVRLCLWGLK